MAKLIARRPFTSGRWEPWGMLTDATDDVVVRFSAVADGRWLAHQLL